MPKSKTPVEAVEKLVAKRRPTPTTKAKATSFELVPQMSLPLWPDSVRGVPNAVLRGALFSVSQRRPIAYERELIASAQGVEIRFTGRRWNQVDLDLLEMILHLARLQPGSKIVEFSANAVLKELGRGTSGQDHEELKNGIARLSSGSVEISWVAGPDKGRDVGGNPFITDYERCNITKRYKVEFHRSLLKLYDDGYSHVHWEERKALGKNSLAKWCHGFYASHALPFPYKVESLRTLCGSTVKRLSEFRSMLYAALDHLIEVGAIVDWHVDLNDLVHVKKMPTQSQAKHLLAKRLKG